MIVKKYLMLITLLASATIAFTQEVDEEGFYTQEKEEDSKLPEKVLHAEPLYIDLIRDLGARKGEKEWNVAVGMTDNMDYDRYEALVEYEWAPINRLGFEVEVPFSYYSPNSTSPNDSVPNHKFESLKLATQWSFFVNQKAATTMAIGYINEFVLSDFSTSGESILTGNTYNPFFIVAKRWGDNFHSLLYTGPVFEQNYQTREVHMNYQINTSFHYMIPRTKNFIGVELNKTIENGDFDMTIRPQMRVSVTDDILIGVVVGIPIEKRNERYSSFLRLIWEPKQKR